MSNIKINVQGLDVNLLGLENTVDAIDALAYTIPDITEDSWIAGTINIKYARPSSVLAVNDKFENIVNVDSNYILFEDPEVAKVFNTNSVGDGNGVLKSKALTLTSINNTWFKGNTSIVSFDEFATYFPNVTTILGNTFENCTNLKTIDLSNILRIENLIAFNNCTNLEIATLSSKCTYIGANAFQYCSKLRDLGDTSKVTEFGQYGVLSCASSLETIDLSSCITFKGNFTDVKNLRSIGSTSNLESIWGGFLNAAMNNYGENHVLLEIGDLDSIKNIGGSSFRGFMNCNNARIYALAVPTLGNYCFVYDNKYPIYVLDHLLDKYKAATYWSALSSRLFGLNTITDGTKDLEKFVTVVGPMNTLYTYYKPFDTKYELRGDVSYEIILGLEYCTIDGGRIITTDESKIGLPLVIRTKGFNNMYTDLSIVAPTSPIIEFADATVKSILLAKGVGGKTYDGEITLKEASLVTTIPTAWFSSNTDIEYFEELQYFTNVNLYTVSGLFYNCTNLKRVLIPSNITALGINNTSYIGIFKGCSSLEYVNLDNVTSVGRECFRDCTSLLNLNLSKAEVIGLDCFTNACISGDVYLDNLTYADVKAFANTTINILGIGKNVTTLNNGAFSTAKMTGNIVLDFPNLTTLGESVFSYNQAVRSVVNLGNINNLKPGSITYNNTYMGTFDGCTNLTTVNLNSKTITIGSDAFRNCTNLVSVTGLDNVVSIGEFAFYKCASLGSVDVTGTKTIYKLAFLDCTSLASIGSLAQTTYIGSMAFYNCPNITSLGTNYIVNHNTEGGRAFTGSPLKYRTMILEGGIWNNFVKNTENLEKIIFRNLEKGGGFCAFYDLGNITNKLKYVLVDGITEGQTFGMDVYSTRGWPSTFEGYYINIPSPNGGSASFGWGASRDVPIYVPVGTKEVWLAASGWSELTNIQEYDFEADPKGIMNYMDEVVYE